MRRRSTALLAAAVALAGISCARPARSRNGPAPAFTRQVMVHGHDLDLHLAPGLPAHRDALLMYVTGDAGWHRKDRDVYTQLTSWGYAAAGFSAPAYLSHLPGDDGTTTPARLASDFASIAESARTWLALDEQAPLVLVGVSRGADLAVVAAGQPGLQRELGGVVAIGLTREEEYVRRRRRPLLAFDLYSYLPRLHDVPLAVIQSTHDNYLPASDARELFGENTHVRAFHAVDARNHSFAGARSTLYATLRQSLSWIHGVNRQLAH